MPTRLHRYYRAGCSHFVTTSCYQRLPLLGSAQDRDLFVHVLEQVRRRYHFVLVGYVVMPEHVHLLIRGPEREDPSRVMQAIKQGCTAAADAPAQRGDSAAAFTLDWAGGTRPHLAAPLLRFCRVLGPTSAWRSCGTRTAIR